MRSISSALCIGGYEVLYIVSVREGGVRCDDLAAARDRIYAAYLYFSSYCRSAYYQDDAALIDRHQIAACLTYAVLVAEPLMVDSAWQPRSPIMQMSGLPSRSLVQPWFLFLFSTIQTEYMRGLRTTTSIKKSGLHGTSCCKRASQCQRPFLMKIHIP